MKPNSVYVRRLLESLAIDMGQLKPGTVVDVRVAHDAWCKIFHGEECNCNPEIRKTIFHQQVNRESKAGNIKQ